MLTLSDKITSFVKATRHIQRHGGTQEKKPLKQLKRLKHQAERAESHEMLRGVEGSAARIWFGLLASTLPTEWSFPGRRKRPPTDPVNALLSLGYTILFHRVEAACQALGLDPSMGFFHEYRPGRSSLACDLMEPYRVSVVDRSVLTALARRQFGPNDFVSDERDQSVTLTDDAFRRYLEIIEMACHKSESRELCPQSQLMRQVQFYCQQLPPWNGEWPVSANCETSAG